MIMHRTDQAAAIRALRSTAPYIGLYKGKGFVIKAGGAVVGDLEATRSLIDHSASRHDFCVLLWVVRCGVPRLGCAV